MNTQDCILITGASGMVGRSLVKLLRSQGYEKILSPTSKELDLRAQTDTFKYIQEQRPKFIFHLAGHIGGIKASITRPVEFMYENIIMGMNVIKAAHATGTEKLLFVGSSCIYPRECEQPMKEAHLLSGTLEPTNEGYSIAKIAGIKLCEYFNHQYKTNFISLIPCNLYGYYDHFEPENSHVISALIYKMHKAKSKKSPQVEVWGTGVSRREFLFVDDFSDAMVFFMNQWDAPQTQPYVNIGLGHDISIRDLALLIQDVVGYHGDIQFNSSAPDGMPKKLLDVSKAKNAGWSPKIDLREGLEKTYKWYKDVAP